MTLSQNPIVHPTFNSELCPVFTNVPSRVSWGEYQIRTYNSQEEYQNQVEERPNSIALSSLGLQFMTATAYWWLGIQSQLGWSRRCYPGYPPFPVSYLSLPASVGEYLLHTLQWDKVTQPSGGETQQHRTYDGIKPAVHDCYWWLETQRQLWWERTECTDNNEES